MTRVPKTTQNLFKCTIIHRQNQPSIRLDDICIGLKHVHQALHTRSTVALRFDRYGQLSGGLAPPRYTSCWAYYKKGAPLSGHPRKRNDSYPFPLRRLLSPFCPARVMRDLAYTFALLTLRRLPAHPPAPRHRRVSADTRSSPPSARKRNGWPPRNKGTGPEGSRCCHRTPDRHIRRSC
jgi:hypothetical protein